MKASQQITELTERLGHLSSDLQGNTDTQDLIEHYKNDLSGLQTAALKKENAHFEQLSELEQRIKDLEKEQVEMASANMATVRSLESKIVDLQLV